MLKKTPFIIGRAGLCLVISLLTLASQADISVPSLFSDHMVLQQEKPVHIWGWADPGESVKLNLEGIAAETITGEDGKWMVQLPPIPAGGPYSLVISGNNEITINDVLVGEVWVASGQSNMQWTSGKSTNADLTRLAARNSSGIRFNRIRNQGSQTPQDKTDKAWEVASPETVDYNSAVAYAFAKTLHEVLGIPIGIIDNAWGGSSCEAWVDRPVITGDPLLANIHEEWLEKEATYDYAKKLAAYEIKLTEWNANPVGQKPRKPHDEMICQHRPGNLWNARILPLAPYTMRGVIWYQGEANAHSIERALQYHHLFSTMIGEWRQLWEEEFPFYFVQLADFREESVFAPNEPWPFLRESQTKTLHSVSNTGQAVIIDIGEGKDIHPREKEEVGRRLARWALNKDYGYKGLAHRSPEFNSWKQDGDTVVVDFDYTGDGLRPFDTHSIHGFVVRSDDGNWHVVEGKVHKGHSVALDVKDLTVTAIRYAWANNPVCNLFSTDGLPVTPFRTDTENTIMEENFSASTLYDVDRAFSARAAEVGTAQAFMEYAAEDAVMYRDRSEPIIGREAIGKLLASDAGSSLVWEPVAGEISASGDLGYTRGKFVYHTAPGQDGTPGAGPFKGYYTSIWKKQADGSWKWVYDGGIITETPGN